MKNLNKLLTRIQLHLQVEFSGEIKRIQMLGYEKDKASFLLLKPKMAYVASRNKNAGLNLFKEIFDRSFPYVTSEKSYLNFCKLIESILAYHKAYGGRD